MDYINPSALRKRTVTRSSLACLPWRARHIKCDGKRPQCSRCAVSANSCDYTRSRRGGLDRAALAERRRRLVEANNLPAGNSLTDPPAIAAAGQIQSEFDSLSGATNVSQSSRSKQPSLSLPDSGIGYAQNVEDDVLIDLYYKRFHKSHPLTVPQEHLFKLWQVPSIQPRLRPLAAVLRLIGHLYRSQEWSTPLQNVIEVCFLQASQTDPFMVQCRVLYSIALFWHGYKAGASHENRDATRLAVDLGMFQREFAAKHGGADTVLRDCWRRTWWMLYIVCGYFAGTLGTPEFAVYDIEATVELPCEEAEYEMGKIPEPKTLGDFECREFSIENTSFSSFAYLIGAVRCAAATVPLKQNITTKDVSQQVICTADSIIDGWLLLLPTDIKQIIDKSGEIDELMFQATLVVHVYVRDQIRMTIGRLRALGQTWPRTARNVQEIQMIARYVLGVKEIGITISPSNVPNLLASEEDGSRESEDGTLSSDIFHALNPLDGLCSMYSAGNLDADLSWWVGS